MSDLRNNLKKTQLFIEQNQRREAIALLNDILNNNPPSNAPDLFWSGLLASQLSAHQPAAFLINEAIKLTPNAPNYYSQYGRVLGDLAEYSLAEEALKKAIQLAPDVAQYHYNLAYLYFNNGKFIEAIESMKQVITIEPAYLEAYIVFAHIFHRQSNYKKMAEYLEKALQLSPEHPEARLLQSFRQKHEGNYSEALATQKHLLEQYPQYYVAWNEYGKMLQKNKDFPEALQAFSQAKALNDLGDARDTHKQKAEKDFEATIAHFHNQNSVKIEPTPLEKVYDIPLFIIGFPRSGTSLLASMLDQHHNLHSAGELSQVSKLRLLANQKISANKNNVLIDQTLWSDKGRELGDLLTDSYQALLAELREEQNINPECRIIDKSPFNVPHLPFIAKISPNSPIINIIRDGREASWSCFTQAFKGYHWYTYSCTDCIHQWELNILHARRYAEVFGLHYYEIHYEKLVQDPETELRALFQFLNLDWNPQCLDFQKTARPVMTASHEQVKNKLYTSSLKMAANYPETYEAMTDVACETLRDLGYLDP